MKSYAVVLTLLLLARASRLAQAAGRCFADRDELREAVSQYTNNPNCLLGQCEASEVYGHPMNSWCVGNVTDMSSMFVVKAFNQDISGWDVSHVTNMQWMFEYTNFNGDISEWDVLGVTDMWSMFAGALSFDRDISE